MDIDTTQCEECGSVLFASDPVCFVCQAAVNDDPDPLTEYCQCGALLRRSEQADGVCLRCLKAQARIALAELAQAARGR